MTTNEEVLDMKFTAINPELTAKEQGYKIDTSVNYTVDQDVAAQYKDERNDPWGNGISDAIDSMYDLDEPVYQGDDGKLYAVGTVYLRDGFKVICYQPLIKA